MNEYIQNEEKSRFRRFIESPITLFLIGMATLALVLYVITKLASNHKETMFALGDIIKMIPSIKA